MNERETKSPLQLELPLETAIPPDPRFEGLDELDLMCMVYDLEKANLPEDKKYIEAARQELERRKTIKREPMT